MNAFASRRRAAEPTPPAPPPKRGLGPMIVEHRAGIGAIIIVVLASALGWAGWNRYAERVRAAADNVLRPDQVDVVGIAPWIRIDLKNEALRDASLDSGLPLDDPELPRRLARAFDIHPWVREVVRVQLRHPAGATIEIRCREPVAMIAVPGGLLPIDAEGNWLPSDDFSPEAAARYPKVRGIASGPRGAVGSAWGDPRVEEAAAVAAVIGPEWERLGLIECRPRAADGEHAAWEFVGEEGLIISFGSAPGHERPGEPTAAVKVARLRALADGGQPTGNVDLAAPESEKPSTPATDTPADTDTPSSSSRQPSKTSRRTA